ncbi:hypothetical protein F751_0036 [Auxenochlorella protothecoides]|uniref:Uncharacterized protein n=1 Tax=Auxenochlorella protothecoides TaxID=3075 RepID=A0A087S9Y6_AUXPR|nr:hypothetical protein F751_0036 [Auxenochlorella protothecoides]KFM22540.1 hypothetical protein F751_0036 [Auxenochlorella protothecoides]
MQSLGWCARLTHIIYCRGPTRATESGVGPRSGPGCCRDPLPWKGACQRPSCFSLPEGIRLCQGQCPPPILAHSPYNWIHPSNIMPRAPAHGVQLVGCGRE